MMSLPIKFFTIAEVAERLEVATRTVRRWIKKGELVSHHFGTAVRVRRLETAAPPVGWWPELSRCSRIPAHRHLISTMSASRSRFSRSSSILALSACHAQKCEMSVDNSLFSGPEAYERFMGRWSRLLARPLIDFTDIADGGRILSALTQTSFTTPPVIPVNSRGITPATANACPLRITVLPTI